MQPGTLRIDSLKRFAARELATHPVTREVIMTQPDELNANEFMLQSRIWLRILMAEGQLTKSR